MSKVYPKDFINEYLKKQISQIIEENHPYLAFSLISSGIEFLGKCLNTTKTNWDYRDSSGPDIKKAIEELMPSYQNLNLTDELRNGMLHMMRPKNKLSLAYIEHTMKGEHLKPHPENENQIVLEIKEFHEDFIKACDKIIERIENQEFDSDNKVYKPFLEVD